MDVLVEGYVVCMPSIPTTQYGSGNLLQGMNYYYVKKTRGNCTWGSTYVLAWTPEHLFQAGCAKILLSWTQGKEAVDSRQRAWV